MNRYKKKIVGKKTMKSVKNKKNDIRIFHLHKKWTDDENFGRKFYERRYKKLRKFVPLKRKR